MQTTIKLIRLPDVEQLTGLKKSTLYALSAKGEFPKVIKLTERSSAWLMSEVEQWINTRISARDTLAA